MQGTANRMGRPVTAHDGRYVRDEHGASCYPGLFVKPRIGSRKTLPGRLRSGVARTRGLRSLAVHGAQLTAYLATEMRPSTRSRSSESAP